MLLVNNRSLKYTKNWKWNHKIFWTFSVQSQHTLSFHFPPFAFLCLSISQYLVISHFSTTSHFFHFPLFVYFPLFRNFILVSYFQYIPTFEPDLWSLISCYPKSNLKRNIQNETFTTKISWKGIEILHRQNCSDVFHSRGWNSVIFDCCKTMFVNHVSHRSCFAPGETLANESCTNGYNPCSRLEKNVYPRYVGYREVFWLKTQIRGNRAKLEWN